MVSVRRNPVLDHEAEDADDELRHEVERHPDHDGLPVGPTVQYKRLEADCQMNLLTALAETTLAEVGVCSGSLDFTRKPLNREPAR
jgi:hypothetical protein